MLERSGRARVRAVVSIAVVTAVVSSGGGDTVVVGGKPSGGSGTRRGVSVVESSTSAGSGRTMKSCASWWIVMARPRCPRCPPSPRLTVNTHTSESLSASVRPPLPDYKWTDGRH